MPRHNHTAKAVHAAASSNTPTSNSYVGVTIDKGHGVIHSYAAATSGGLPMAPEALAEAGRSQPHENRQPALAVNFCIALNGVFPVRN